MYDLASATCDLTSATCDVTSATCHLTSAIRDVNALTGDRNTVKCDRDTVRFDLTEHRHGLRSPCCDLDTDFRGAATDTFDASSGCCDLTTPQYDVESSGGNLDMRRYELRARASDVAIVWYGLPMRIRDLTGDDHDLAL